MCTSTSVYKVILLKESILFVKNIIINKLVNKTKH